LYGFEVTPADGENAPWVLVDLLVSLFADLRTVLDDLAQDDIVMQDYMDLSNRLDNAEDKLNKAVEGFETGASAGKENLQSWGNRSGGHHIR
jgi:hypothetical protein